MKFLRYSSIGLLALAGILWLLTSGLMCMPGEACYLGGFGMAFLFSLPAMFLAGLFSRIVAISVAIASLWGFSQNLVIALDPVRNPMERVNLIKAVCDGKQMVVIAKLGGYPGDLPVKTDKEYIEFLVHNDFLLERDLTILGYKHWHAKTLAELAGHAIAYTIYRVSKDDPPDTVFLVLKPDFDKKRCIVIRKDGDGKSGLRSSLEPALPLPPRQPQTLEAVP